MKKYIGFLIVALLLVGAGMLSGVLTDRAEAQPVSQYNLTGWAWSSNIGWIKFDTGVENAVYVQNAGVSGSIKPILGYAWSSNIGWIKFGGLGTSPDGSPSDATVNILGGPGSVSGWARACAGTVNGDCNSASRTDGWDGWIKLSNLAYSTGTGKITGYAWGSDVVGWVQFDVRMTDTVLPSIAGTCERVPIGDVMSGDDVVYTASISTPGVVSPTYTWPSIGGTQNGKTYTLSNAASSLSTFQVSVKASGFLDSSFTCTGFNVNLLPTGATLYFNGRTNTNLADQKLRIKAGTPVRVNYSVPSGATCSLGLTQKPYAYNGAAVGWQTTITDPTTDFVSATDMIPGVYKVDLSCHDTDEPAVSVPSQFDYLEIRAVSAETWES